MEKYKYTLSHFLTHSNKVYRAARKQQLATSPATVPATCSAAVTHSDQEKLYLEIPALKEHLLLLSMNSQWLISFTLVLKNILQGNEGYIG